MGLIFWPYVRGFIEVWLDVGIESVEFIEWRCFRGLLFSGPLISSQIVCRVSPIRLIQNHSISLLTITATLIFYNLLFINLTVV